MKQPVLATEPLEAAREQSDSRLWNPQSARESLSNGGTETGWERGRPGGFTVPGLKVNLDPKLLEMLRDVHYLQRSPHDVSCGKTKLLLILFDV